MRRTATIAFALALVIAATAAGWVWYRAGRTAGADASDGTRTVAGAEPVRHSPQAMLYCEFTNFFDRTPIVGFYFEVEPGAIPGAYTLAFRRESDGTQTDFPDGPGGQSWAFDGAANPAVLSAPDDATAINIYAYEPGKPGTTWFEAGLRSVQYKNLGGRCRLTR